MKNFTLDFIGVGAPRSATTWLYQCLDEHPSVCMSRPKELNHFLDETVSCSTRALGGEWYRSRFGHCTEHALCGEISPLTLCDPGSANRIKAEFPEAKIIILLRRPDEALHSWYHYLLHWSVEEPTFEEFVSAHPDRVNVFDYAPQLKRYFSVFPRSQILILLHEEIVRDPKASFDRVSAFLGIPSSDPPSLHAIANAVRVSSRFYAKLHGMLRNSLQRSKFLTSFYNCFRAVDRAANTLFSQTRRAPQPMPSRIQEDLMRRYEASNIETSRLIGIDLSHWNTGDKKTVLHEPNRIS